MGFKEARALLTEALLDGHFTSELRLDVAQKNLLSTGEATPAFVVWLLRRCRGWEYSTSRHHFRDVECHVFTPATEGERWYIKAYFEPARAVFISVHR